MREACPQFEALRVRAADDRLPSAEAVTLETHLAACPACAADVRVQSLVRSALRKRATELVDPAPDVLRDRVARLVERGSLVEFAPRAAGGRTSGGRAPRVLTWMPRSVAAALVIALVGVAAIGAFTPRGVLLAAELALDHLKCLVVADTDDQATPDGLEREWLARRGWAVEIAPSAPDLGLRLVGLRTCLSHAGHMAHVLYDLDGHRLSVYVIPDGERAVADTTLFGHRAATWTAGGRTYGVVADVADSRLDAVVSYLQQHVH